MTAVRAPERPRAPCRTARVAVVVASPLPPGALRRLLVGLRHPHVDVVVVTGSDGRSLRRAVGRDATVVSVPDSTTASTAAVRAGAAASAAPAVVILRDAVLITAEAALRLAEALARGAAVVLPDPVAPEEAPAGVATPAVLATRRTWLVDLPGPPDGVGSVEWCTDLLAGSGRVERCSEARYLGLGRATRALPARGTVRRR
jgi:hypothetical protein